MKRFYCTNCGFEYKWKKDIWGAFCQRCLKPSMVEIPDFETPEQYRERTGKPWPDEAPVWSRYVLPGDKGLWGLSTYDESKVNAEVCEEHGYTSEIILATEDGPPPDDWKPEE